MNKAEELRKIANEANDKDNKTANEIMFAANHMAQKGHYDIAYTGPMSNETRICLMNEGFKVVYIDGDTFSISW